MLAAYLRLGVENMFITKFLLKIAFTSVSYILTKFVFTIYQINYRYIINNINNPFLKKLEILEIKIYSKKTQQNI